MYTPFRVGCAGWSLPKEHQSRFPAEGTHLQRYAARLPAVEINSSFYRPHRPTTYARWAAGVPAGFRFSVKVPRQITHTLRLSGAAAALDAFLTEVGALGTCLGPLLIQLPPSLQFDGAVAAGFLADLRARHQGPVALEPRHPSWFEPAAADLLIRHRIARVAADPACVPLAAEPGGSGDLVYIRLHGAPRIYYSAYDAPYLHALAERLRAANAGGADVWCIFDNTALGAAVPNAFALLDLLTGSASEIA